jgi:5-methylcytosine-specific restriction endonuclease McrA
MHTIASEGTLEPARPAVAVGLLTDAELEDRLKRLTGIERKAQVLLLAHLGEFDDRRLYAGRGHPSLFAYCLQVLGYSEQAAYKRIQAARAARAHPEILQRLADGKITMTAVVILAPHLRQNNASELLSEARGRRTRDVEALAARLSPRPDRPDLLRALPAPASAPAAAPGQAAAPAPEAAESTRSPAAPRLSGAGIEQLSADRHLFRFTGSAELRAKYERAKGLMLSSRKERTMEAVVEAGLDALLDRLDPERRIARRRAKAARRIPLRASARNISLVLRDAVWSRDGGRCVFIGPDGGRCPATTGLEIDHIRPYALGGSSDDPSNLRVMCRTHNQLLARRVFGGAAGPRART